MKEGMPSRQEYLDCLSSAEFNSMETFSGRFLSRNKGILRRYTQKWVADPLHQWSRQWEYPFVYIKIREAVMHASNPHILDAGSGLTFFPHYLATMISDADVTCCDYDHQLEHIYAQMARRTESRVTFKTADLRTLPYAAENFHAVYCISVLEHTSAYENIIDEFHRILRPGGLLVVTFDVSLDGARDIDLLGGNQLLSTLQKRFSLDQSLSMDLSTHASEPGLFTTLTAKEIDEGLLPWRRPAWLYRLKSLVTTGRLGSWPPPMSVFCLCLKKI